MSTPAQQKELYNLSLWRKRRIEILTRDGWLCRCPECVELKLTKGAAIVHHIRQPWDAQGPERERLKWADENLISVSRECHRRLHEKAASLSVEEQGWKNLVDELVDPPQPRK